MYSDKHIPIRTCAGCRKKSAKAEMIRVVVTKGEPARDEKQKLSGRGRYACSEDCYNKLSRGHKSNERRTKQS